MARTRLAAWILLALAVLAAGCEDPRGKNQATAEAEDVLPPDVAGGDDAALEKTPGEEGGEGLFTAAVDAPQPLPEAPAGAPAKTPATSLPSTVSAPLTAPATTKTPPPEKPPVEKKVVAETGAKKPPAEKPAAVAAVAQKPPVEKPPVSGPGSPPSSGAEGALAAGASGEAAGGATPAETLPPSSPDTAPDTAPATTSDTPADPGAAMRLALNPMAGVDDMAKPPPDAPAATPPQATPPEAAPPPASTTDGAAAAPPPAERPAGSGTRLVDLRVGGHEGYDRIVFQFEGKMPLYDVDSLAAPAAACRPGEALSVTGARWLRVQLSGLSADPALLRAERTFRLSALREMELVCRDEGELVWVLGLESLRRARVTTLARPARLVVDVLH